MLGMGADAPIPLSCLIFHRPNFGVFFGHQQATKPKTSRASDRRERSVVELCLALQRVADGVARIIFLQFEQLGMDLIQQLQRGSVPPGCAVLQSGEQDVIGQTQVLLGRESF